MDAFCDHPDQWDMLAGHPELAPRAVEEVMRHSPIIFKTLRIPVADVCLGGLVIPAGTPVFVNSAAANRDPAVYDAPERLDVTRDAAAPMLTFGGGTHVCLGAHLARVELAEALIALTRLLARRTARRTLRGSRSRESPAPPRSSSTTFRGLCEWCTFKSGAAGQVNGGVANARDPRQTGSYKPECGSGPHGGGCFRCA